MPATRFCLGGILRGYVVCGGQVREGRRREEGRLHLEYSVVFC